MMHTELRDETGSVAPFMIVIAFALLMIAALVVDGGGYINAQQRADSAAGQAARTGGEQIREGQAVEGDRPEVNAAQARGAAQRYLAAANIDGSVSTSGGTRLVVTTDVTYKPLILGIIGIGSRNMQGRSEVSLVRGVNQPEER